MNLSVFLILFSTYMFSQTTISKNVFGQPLIPCCYEPMTGFYRDGFCKTDKQDRGTHVVCAVMTKEFLDYTTSCGNDLCTPIPAYNFPGLQPSDKWCLCISRWLQAEKAGKAPKIILEATSEIALDYTTIELLIKYASK